MRPLSADDLTLLGTPEPAQTSLKKIRDHHHAIARLVAMGKRTGEIAEMTGMSLSRISILKADPSFQQLVAVYRERLDKIQDEEFRDVQALRASIEYLALEAIRDRIEDDSDPVSIRDLHDLAAEMADRLGRTKVTRSVTGQFNLADSLAEARRRKTVTLSASPHPPDTERDAVQGPDSSPPAELPAPAGEGK